MIEGTKAYFYNKKLPPELSAPAPGLYIENSVKIYITELNFIFLKLPAHDRRNKSFPLQSKICQRLSVSAPGLYTCKKIVEKLI